MSNYKPGWESREFHHLLRTERAAIRREVDRRFREQTKITRRLNPTSPMDAELRRTWLRIRDAVMNKRMDEAIAEQMELKRELLMGPDFPFWIVEEMNWNGWIYGAELLETWAERPPAIAPNYSAPVTNLVKMDWVLQFARAKSVYDKIMNEMIWKNNAGLKRMSEVLKQKPRALWQRFGDLTRPVIDIDKEWINAGPVQNGFAVDALAAALGSFELKVAIAGVVKFWGEEAQVAIEEVGIYVKDSFDFNGDQFLGFWGYADDPINNSDFRQWREENSAGGDFRVFSDVKRSRLPSANVVVKVT